MWTSSLTDQRYKLKAVLLIPSLFPFYASEVLLPKHYLQVNSVVMTASQRTQTHGWYQEWSEKAGSNMGFGSDHLLLERKGSPSLCQFPMAAVKHCHTLRYLNTQIYYL